jgi:L-galactonate 5-dehydrogenase
VKAFAIVEKEKIQSITVSESQPKPNEVLLEIHYIGLCGTDISTYRGNNSLAKFPRIPGHEISAVIISTGADVPDTLKVGDKATVSPYTHCGVCPACRAGRFNTCEFNQTLGVQRDGALTNFISVPYEKVFTSKILSSEELALVEPLSVGYHAANRAIVNEQDTVLIFGCGAIGMGAICASVRKGATVIAADIDDNKLAVAKKYGAAYVVNTKKENIAEVIGTLSRNEGVSVAIEAAGTEQTQRMAIENVSFAGRVAMIGYAKSEVTIDTRLIVKKELNLFGSRNALRVFPSVISMLEKREKPYLDLISKIYPFEDTPRAFNDWNANPDLFSKILIQVKQ